MKLSTAAYAHHSEMKPDAWTTAVTDSPTTFAAPNATIHRWLEASGAPQAATMYSAASSPTSGPAVSYAMLWSMIR